MIFSRKKKEPAAAAEKESLPEENEILKMKGITKDYVMGDEVSHVLKGIDLTVTKGEFLAVLGPSGSGKSTLMNIIGCLDTPTSGDYWLSGRHIAVQSEATLARIRSKEIGFIFQSFYLLQRQTAFENVELPLIYSGMSEKERKKRDVWRYVEPYLLLIRWTIIPTSFPADSSRELRLRERLRTIRRFFLLTNRPVRWIRIRDDRSWSCSIR